MRPTSPKELLTAADLPALFLTDFTNIRYLTGLLLSAGVLLIQPRKSTLFVDSRYKDMAVRAGGSLVLRDLSEVADVLKTIDVCGFEADQVPVARFANWKKKIPNTKFVRTSGVVEEFRRAKEDDELRLLRKAHRITRELLRRVPSALRKSTTEERLARQLHVWALELGADGLAFDPIVAFGTHTSSPHHRPTSRALQKGHLVQIDVGAKVKGYCGDMSEVYFTAKPTALQKKVYDTLTEAKNKAMRSVKAGVTTHALDRIARDVLKRDGFDAYFTHALGHGVGLDIHEGVTLSQKAPAQTLLAGEVITIEPGVYFDGKWGMRVEDMIVVQG